ncbi:tumor necrosis factor receptor superfamily member 5-like [Seriola dumerili]|nr:tumor necrosis factor receptor superfamily member 5-like [Seriola dumerili]
MLRLPTKITKMRLLLGMMICASMGMTAAQPRCDPLTQYVVDGQCCKMCSPGNHMLSSRSCQEPQCKECGENEYQDKYTTDSKCQRQPYCDANKNFRAATNDNKKKRITCMCKVGFHCSSDACITCVPHTTCKPGHGALSIGNQTHDTVCQKCPEGSFSNEDSWSSDCKKWKECKNGQQKGTDISDNVCVETSRQHIVVGAVVAGVILILAGVIFGCTGDARRKVKGCVASCHGERWEVPRETRIPVTPDDDTDKEPMFPVRQLSQEESSTRTPEENLDELSAEGSMDPNRTENGNYVGQEMGKTETLSRQESQTEPLHRQLSQTQTFTD